ncbi:hypothetical protein cyc_00863 [Cyclospora cayetanensis]|uniref:Uncharacterized protein n=1 Tax=Cyclospora cayetanensis TaxID=88456 RepID=A0A1D3CZ77_9EIME|nr:hypothetical protein cyc_00863 [Cyclospora cayetanensis]
MSLLQASFASDTESDDEDFECSGIANSSSDSEDEGEDDIQNAWCWRASCWCLSRVAFEPLRLLSACCTRRCHRQNKRTEKLRQQLQQRAAADAVYEELRKQHQLAVKGYPASVAADNLLLRFHKRMPSVRSPATSASVLGALALHCSKPLRERGSGGEWRGCAAEERLPKDYVNLLEELFRKVGKGCDLCAAGAGALRDAGAALTEEQSAERLARDLSLSAVCVLLPAAARRGGRACMCIWPCVLRIEEKVSAERFAAFEKRQQKQHVQVKGKLQALDALDKGLVPPWERRDSQFRAEITGGLVSLKATSQDSSLRSYSAASTPAGLGGGGLV